MNFRNWMEATFSSDDIGEAMKKSLEFGVEGGWRDVRVTGAFWRSTSP